MNIITEIKDSITNKEFYKSLPAGKTLTHSVKYLAKLSLIVALIMVVVFSPNITKVKKALIDGMSSVVSSFPENLAVSLKDGMVSINQPEPYFVPLSPASQESLKNDKDDYSQLTNAVVIDTTAPFSIEKFKSYNTFALLTKTDLITVKSGGQIQIIPLSKFGNWNINKAWTIEKESNIIKILPEFIVGFIIGFYIAIFLMIFIGTLISVLFYGLIVWIMAKIQKMELSYKNSYKIAIHAMTLLIILSILNVYTNVFSSFLFRIAAFILIVYINFFSKGKVADNLQS